MPECKLCFAVEMEFIDWRRPKDRISVRTLFSFLNWNGVSIGD